MVQGTLSARVSVNSTSRLTRALVPQVMPVVTTLLGPILSKYGFAPNQAGLMQFVMAGSAGAAKDDEECCTLARSMRDRVVPPEMVCARFSCVHHPFCSS